MLLPDETLTNHIKVKHNNWNRFIIIQSFKLLCSRIFLRLPYCNMYLQVLYGKARALDCSWPELIDH